MARSYFIFQGVWLLHYIKYIAYTISWCHRTWMTSNTVAEDIFRTLTSWPFNDRWQVTGFHADVAVQCSFKAWETTVNSYERWVYDIFPKHFLSTCAFSHAQVWRLMTCSCLDNNLWHFGLLFLFSSKVFLRDLKHYYGCGYRILVRGRVLSALRTYTLQPKATFHLLGKLRTFTSQSYTM